MSTNASTNTDVPEFDVPDDVKTIDAADVYAWGERRSFRVTDDAALVELHEGRGLKLRDVIAWLSRPDYEGAPKSGDLIIWENDRAKAQLCWSVGRLVKVVDLWPKGDDDA